MKRMKINPHGQTQGFLWSCDVVANEDNDDAELGCSSKTDGGLLLIFQRLKVEGAQRK